MQKWRVECRRLNVVLEEWIAEGRVVNPHWPDRSGNPLHHLLCGGICCHLKINRSFGTVDGHRVGYIDGDDFWIRDNPSSSRHDR